MNRIIFLLLFTFSISAFADLVNTLDIYERTRGKKRLYDQLVSALINDGYYFAALPFAKEYLSTTRNVRINKEFEYSLEKLIGEVGVRQFETLPDSILRRSDATVIRYIRAKKFFRRGEYDRALALVDNVSSTDPIYPFFKMLEASIHSLKGDFKRAIENYEACQNNTVPGNLKFSAIRLKQYEVVKDYCLVGRARSHYAVGDFDKANEIYLDLPKSSFVWPEILFEEAWTSYGQRNFNRSLGKLVTYNAPVFDSFFIPEIDVLEALSYLGLCLYGDSKKVVDEFYQTYLEPSNALGRLIKSKGKDYDYFFKVSRARRSKEVPGGQLYNKILKSIVYEPGYQELNQALDQGVLEFNKLKRESPTVVKKLILQGYKDTLLLQKRLVGSYVRKQLILKYALLKKAFTQMSYIKLEVLTKTKSQLYYKNYEVNRERGDFKYLQRNDKQYFWSFNGEFWADELGDYVFSLQSECN